MRRHLTLLALTAACLASCHDSPTSTSRAIVHVAVRVSGGEANDQSFQLVVDSMASPYTLGTPNADLAVAPGKHALAIHLAAVNCTVSGSNPVTVDLPDGGDTAVTFDVACATTGAQISVRTNGSDVPRAYSILVNGSTLWRVDPNGSVVISRLAPGTSSLTLSTPASNCTVLGSNPVAVPVMNRTVTPVAFQLTCTALTRSAKIAFEANEPDATGADIHLINPDGSNDVDLAAGSAPSWSPDGKQLALFEARCTDTQDLCDGIIQSIDPESGEQVDLTTTTTAASPAWSPNGKTIAYIACCDLPRILIVPVDGSPSTSLLLPAVYDASGPAWSPDGRRIAFQCDVVQGKYDLCVINTDGTGFTRLISADTPEGRPAWSPDGKSIAFVTVDTKTISIMASDGSNVRTLTSGFDPAWSPDGTKLVFARDDGLFVMNADGSNVRRLTTGNHRAPAWRP